MRCQIRSDRALVIGAGVVLAGAGGARAQQVIVKQFDNAGLAGAGSPKTTVPGLPASQTAQARVWSSVTGFWAGDPNGPASLQNPLPAIDSAGNIVFFGQIATATGVIATSGTNPMPNANAIFYATRADNYAFTNSSAIIARDGTPGTGVNQGGIVPAGLFPNWQLDSSTPLSGITYGVGVSSNGQIAMTAVCNGNDGAGNTATNNVNNSVIFTGTTSTLNAVARRSITAPSTGGNTLGGSNLNVYNFANASNSLVVNPSGQTFFIATLATGAGPVVSSSGANANETSLWIGAPGASAGNLSNNLTKVARKGEFVNGVSGEVFGLFNVNNTRALNAAGDVIFTDNLSTTATQGITSAGVISAVGVTAASTAANNIFYFRPASTGTLTPIAREGSTVGGASSLATAVYKTDASGTTNAPYIAQLSHQSLNNSGHVLYDAFFNVAGPISSAANAEAMMLYSAGASTPLFQTGVTPVPGVASATFQQFWAGSSQAATASNASRINNQDHVLLVGQMTPGPSVTANTNDQGMWLVNNATPTLIARGGDAAPGAGGAIFSNTFLSTGTVGTNNAILNNSDHVVFQNVLSDGRTGLFAWTPTDGLFPLLFTGDTSIFGSNYPLSSFTYNITSNGDGGVQSLNDSGMFTLRVASTAGGGNNAIILLQVPAPGGAALVGLACLLGARRRRPSLSPR